MSTDKSARPDSSRPSFIQNEDTPLLLAVSLMRGGMDTLAARHAKTVLRESPRARWLQVIAERVWQTPAHQRQGIEWAEAGAEQALKLAKTPGIQLLTCLDPEYPAYLSEIPDPPVVLWVQGSVAALSTQAVAVVGSREALPVSLGIARRLARDLAEVGVTVVSGLARGVDTAAHTGSIEGGGPTIAVLGSGLDRIYPKRNIPLATQIADIGAVVSELPPDRVAHARHFPLRNRIISGLSRGTVIVEASEKSGSLITARLALEQNRSVMAMPGGTVSGRHRGCHALLKDGARLVESVEDVLEELGWPRNGPLSGADSPNHLQLSYLEANMAKGETYSVDQLAGLTGRSASELLTDLCGLELSGRVVRTAGGQFVRMAGPETLEG